MRKTVAYAFHHSIPILIGFFPVGLAYGLLMPLLSRLNAKKA